MAEITITLELLRGMIGSEVRHHGNSCRVVEVLEDVPAVVLEDASHRDLQPTQFGDPRRTVPATYTVPVLDPEQRQIHPDFLALGLLKQPD